MKLLETEGTRSDDLHSGFRMSRIWSQRLVNLKAAQLEQPAQQAGILLLRRLVEWLDMTNSALD
jgi:hypothetical protein